MEKNDRVFEDVIFSNRSVDSFTGMDRYESASSIGDDLKTALLADLELDEAVCAWEGDLRLLCGHTWVHGCKGVVERLVQLREISPLDIVAVSALTDRVSLRPFICSLALALRKLLQRVVLMDCDLRTPSLHTVVAGEGKEGFIDMVKYGCSFSTSSSETEVEGIYVIGAGSHPVSSEGELVGRELERVFHSLRTKADITLVCVPPFLVRKQINPILSCMDGVLLCVNGSAGSRSKIREDFSALWRSDIPVVGIVAQETSRVEETQTVVLRAKTEDGQRLTPEAPAAGVEEENKPVARVSALCDADRDDRPKTVGSSPSGERQSFVWKPISSVEEEAASGESLSQDAVHEEDTPRDDSDFVDKTLFGKQRQWRQYIIGICVVLGIIGVLALKQTRFPGSGSTQMDERMMRSILLPGSDGVMTADETRRPQTAAASNSAAVSISSGGSGSAAAAAVYVEVSSRTYYDEAASDSLEVAVLGFRVSVRHIDNGDRGAGYRVVAGPFLTVDGARAAMTRIKPLGLSSETRVITEGVK